MMGANWTLSIAPDAALLTQDEHGLIVNWSLGQARGHCSSQSTQNTLCSLQAKVRHK